MRFALAAALKDLRWRMADPSALLIWLGIPALLAALFGMMSAGGSGTPTARVLVLDEDGSLLSRVLAGAGSARNLGEALVLEPVGSREVGLARMDRGEASALLILPEGFTSAVIEERPVTLRLVTNPAQRLLPGVVEEGLEIVVEAAFYAQRLFGEQLRQMSGSGAPTDQRVMELAAQINQRMNRVGPVLFPPLLDLQFEAAEEPGGTAGFATLFFPGVILMSLVLIAQGFSDDFWRERHQGVLRRLASAPQPVWALLVGRLLAGAVMMAMVAGLGLVIGAVLFDLPPVRLPLALLWSTFAGTVLLLLFGTVQLFGSSQRTAGLLTSLIMFPLLMLGGSFFPFETMPGWMAAAGRLTPNGLAVTRLKDILLRDIDWPALVVGAAGIGLAGVLAFGVSAVRLRGRFMRGEG